VTVLALAVLLDLSLGEPAGRWHPVTWIGGLIRLLRRIGPRGGAAALLVYGGVLMGVVIGVVAGAVLLFESFLSTAPMASSVVFKAIALKCSFSLRSLFTAVELVRGHLVAGDLSGARRELGVHLVSRSTADLDRQQVASGAVESLAENLTDAWVAPICFFLAGGLEAAWVYRAVNTADAMIGYRVGELEHLGRVAARLDDALNFVPARLAALSLVAGAWLAGRSASGAWRLMRRDGGLTASPNAGRTMAAMAGALGVSLEKPGHYRLGDGPHPDVLAVDRALTVGRGACAVWLAVALLVARGFS